MSYKVSFVKPSRIYEMLKNELDTAYFEVMSRGDLIDRGQLRSFEENLAKFVGAKYAVGLNSGYDALHLSLRAAEIEICDKRYMLFVSLMVNLHNGVYVVELSCID